MKRFTRYLALLLLTLLIVATVFDVAFTQV